MTTPGNVALAYQHAVRTVVTRNPYDRKNNDMPEQQIVEATPHPRTRLTLADDLRALGLQPGQTVLVHSALRSLGWVAGGPVAVTQALLDVLTDAGTLVMPTHTADNSDPANWSRPPVPAAWHQVIRDAMPGFDPAISPTRSMGSIPETFRSWPGVVRSYHPTSSFAALGPNAATITQDHGLDDSLGESSPLARMYDLDGQVLLLGVGYDRNTSFHLAEYRVPGAQRITTGSAILREGVRAWVSYRDIDVDDGPFPDIGAAFEQTGQVRIANVGSATAKFFPQRPAVNFALEWLLQHFA
jgi:aminoglycoside 3-N-acetyltransferase